MVKLGGFLLYLLPIPGSLMPTSLKLVDSSMNPALESYRDELIKKTFLNRRKTLEILL